MIENEKTETGGIVCPWCKEVIVPDGGKTSGLTSTPKGLWIIHKACLEAYNELALFMRD